MTQEKRRKIIIAALIILSIVIAATLIARMTYARQVKTSCLTTCDHSNLSLLAKSRVSLIR